MEKEARPIQFASSLKNDARMLLLIQAGRKKNTNKEYFNGKIEAS
jgi:hypothetical protein